MKNHSFTDSLRHAIDGIMTLLKEERNMRIHFVMTILVVVCAVLFGLSRTETAIVVSLCGAVICAELINTAIENAINISTAVFNMYAKRAKDAAAGAVLVISIGAAIGGLIIFIPHGIDFIKNLIG
ncbi:MAG: diacylglycerol kinase family protein [Ruminococcaceae bacterium]|nr:diacylglycerol kinase family protein [Oscillospiraceae bacterium]